MKGPSQTPEKTPDEIALIVDDLRVEMNKMEWYYSHLKDNISWLRLREELLDMGLTSGDMDLGVVETFYQTLILLLGKISAERAESEPSNIITLDSRIIAKRRQGKAPENEDEYLPGTFSEFIDRQRPVHAEEYFKEGVNAAGDAIVMGEVFKGLGAVVFTHREGVRSRILKIISGNPASKGGPLSIILAADEERLLKLLNLKKEELIGQSSGIMGMAILGAILDIRDAIDREYAKPKRRKKELALPAASAEQLSALKTTDPGVSRLLKAVRVSPQSPIETGRDLRLRTAARVARIVIPG